MAKPKPIEDGFRWLAALLLLGLCLVALFYFATMGCCRELHVHIAERVYVTKAVDEQSDRQGPDEIIEELINDLTGTETNREAAGKP